jgi:hypothetical protein
VADPGRKQLWHGSFEELWLACDLPREEPGHEQLDDDRAPAKRPALAVEVVGAVVDRHHRKVGQLVASVKWRSLP